MAYADYAAAQLGVPPSIADSRLMRSGGVIAVEGLVSSERIAGLVADSKERFADANRSLWSGVNQEDWRGGDPSRALTSTPAGPEHFQVFGSEGMLRALSQLTGIELEAASAGTYSYYVEPGDHLALHRDIRVCDITVILCLEDIGRAASANGALLLAYPAYAWLPLRELHAGTGAKAVEVRLAPGQAAILAGGIVPHQVTPLAQGQRRTVSLTCYKLAPLSS